MDMVQTFVLNNSIHEVRMRPVGVSAGFATIQREAGDNSNRLSRSRSRYTIVICGQVINDAAVHFGPSIRRKLWTCMFPNSRCTLYTVGIPQNKHCLLYKVFSLRQTSQEYYCVAAGCIKPDLQ